MIPTAVNVRLESDRAEPHYAAFNKHSETLCFIPLDVMPVSEDTARLDWLAARSHMRVHGSKANDWLVLNYSSGLTVAGRGATAREAIDAARAKGL